MHRFVHHLREGCAKSEGQKKSPNEERVDLRCGLARHRCKANQQKEPDTGEKEKAPRPKQHHVHIRAHAALRSLTRSGKSCSRFSWRRVTVAACVAVKRFSVAASGAR